MRLEKSMADRSNVPTIVPRPRANERSNIRIVVSPNNTVWADNGIQYERWILKNNDTK